MKLIQFITFLIFSPETVIFNNTAQSFYHIVSQSMPRVWISTIPIPYPKCTFEHFIRWTLTEKLGIFHYITPNVFDGVHVTLMSPSAGQGSNFIALSWSKNHSLIFIAWWIGDLSWTNLTRLPGNLAWIDGSRTSPMIARYFSLSSFPFMRMKSPAPLAENQTHTGTVFLPLLSVTWTWFLAKRVPLSRQANTRPHSSELIHNTRENDIGNS